MKLRSLNISVHPESASSAKLPKHEATCGFCGLRAGLHAMPIGNDIACVLCGLVQSLHRPTIDDEVRLIWLPELSQSAMNVLLRQVHLELHGLGESVHCDDLPRHPEGTRPLLYYAQRILLERGEFVRERLGSIRAGDLADALTTLERRHVDMRSFSLGGLRVLSAGRYYIAGVNVYEAIVDSWLEASEKHKSVSFGDPHFHIHNVMLPGAS
jgi:intracellular multiplication protein IcmJ